MENANSNTSNTNGILFQYFSHLVNTTESNKVEVKYISHDVGHGVFLKGDQVAKKDEVLILEKPLIAMQHIDNRASAWTCGNCFQFLGGLQEQLAKHQQLLQLLRQVELAPIPFNTTLKSPPIYECFMGCGEAYCSEDCRTQAFNKHHQLLCVGQLTSQHHPLFLFKQHAIENYELFLLAAQAIARVLLEWKSNGRDLHKALFPFSAFQKKHWWEVRRAEDDTLSEEHLKSMLQASVSLLKAALFPHFEKEPDSAQLNYLFTLDFYSYLLGLFEINDNSIEFASPLQIFLQKELPFMPEPTRTAVWKLLEPTVNIILQEQLEENSDEEEEDDAMEEAHEHGKEEESHSLDEDNFPIDIPEGLRNALSNSFVFPPFQGLGLFPLEALTNHSCAPNTIVKFDKDNTCRLYTLRDIKPGEELTHSYIENELELEQRQLDLRTYGFVCNCPKCTAETNGTPFME